MNTLGNLDYKLRMGFVPQIAKDSATLTEVPVNEEGIVLFFGNNQNNSVLTLYALKPKSSDVVFEQSRFANQEMPFQTIEY